ncbi:hypothetical protein QR680_013417 [Steinernema hermaphroditum]|uniref:BHLH domain-containing protein n=1 Tax=Steinernema hermaphroditum TaxID=289476 RepID=A0AA39I5G2_9BILA|nr:hypothetical protein QR680_013417 [Steinernema hermaphroditum]
MSSEPIHSGHFMTSNPHEQVDDEDEDVEVEVVDEEDRNTDSRAESAITDRDEKPVTFYKFGPRKTQSIAIDVSLNKLNKCLKVAYNKMTTPKWKDFKGIRLPCSQRIRLNNVIWRAYYMEFKRPKRPKEKTFCYFAVPDDDATHTKIGGSVLEGMYWKRRMKAVCAQYKRWRHYIPSSKKKDIREPKQRGRNASCSCDTAYTQTIHQSHTPPPNYGTETFFDEDDIFPDSILDGLDEPFWFPNVREIQSDNADTIQPGLLPLQPNMPAQDSNIEEIKKWMVSSDDSSYMPQQPPANEKPAQNRNTSVASNPRSVGYSTKDYDAANVLVDYSNQRAAQQHAPARPQLNPSTVPEISIPVTPALMSTPHMTQPFYSQAVYGQQHHSQSQFGHQSSVPEAGSPFDYTPQFLAAAVASTGASPFSPYGNMVLGSGQNQPNARWWVSTSSAGHGHSINHHLQHQGLQPMKQLIATDKPPSGGSPFSCDSLINFGGADQLSTRQRTVSESIAHLFHPAAANAQSFALSQHELQLQQMQADSKNVISQHHSLRSIVDHSSKAAAGWGSNSQYLRASVAAMRSTIQHPPAKIPRLDITVESIPQPLFPQISTQLMGSAATAGVVVNSTAPSADASSTASANSSPPTVTALVKPEPTLTMRKWSEPENPPQTATISSPLSVPPTPASQISKKRTLSTDANPASHPADSTVHPGDRKRMVHLKAEQNRRSALKDGFDQLMKIVPDLYSNGLKPTNAAVLAKAAERLRGLQQSAEKFENDEKALDEQISKLSARISTLQSTLPKKKSTLSKSPTDQKTQIKNFFDKYTKERTKEDFRFWIMSQMLEPFIESFAASMSVVDTTNRIAISDQCHKWFTDHWSNAELQPYSTQVLINLVGSTNIMEDPESLKDDILGILGIPKKP